jgi:hypothetical protein
MNTLLKYLKVFAILIASFFVFSVLSRLMPYESVRKNIEKSLPDLQYEESNPKAILNEMKYHQDDFTHALIINIIASSDSKRPIWSAMANPFFFQAPDIECWYAFKHLDYKIKNIDSPPNEFYCRYWFGSASVTKILLLVINYQQIKWLLYVVST